MLPCSFSRSILFAVWWTWYLFALLFTLCMPRFVWSCFFVLLPMMCSINNGHFTCCRNEVKQYITFDYINNSFVCVVSFSNTFVLHKNNAAVCIINSPAIVLINANSLCTTFSRHNEYNVLLATLYNNVIIFIELVMCVEEKWIMRCDYIDCFICTVRSATIKSLLKNVTHSLLTSCLLSSSSGGIDETDIIYLTLQLILFVCLNSAIKVLRSNSWLRPSHCKQIHTHSINL